MMHRPAQCPHPGLRTRVARAGEGRLRRARYFIPFAIIVVFAAFFSSFAGSGFASEDRTLPPQPQGLPSGQLVEPYDMHLEVQADGQHWLILRYLAPRIAFDGGDLGYDAVASDLDALCNGPGMQVHSALLGRGRGADQIVVTLMDRPVPRGQSDPVAALFISAYRPEAGECAWQ